MNRVDLLIKTTMTIFIFNVSVKIVKRKKNVCDKSLKLHAKIIVFVKIFNSEFAALLECNFSPEISNFSRNF